MKIRHYLMGITILILDQLSKYLVVNNKLLILSDKFSFTYIRNYGAAFGIGDNKYLSIISILIILAIIFFLALRCNKSDNPTPYVLIISGSIGNLIDRIFKGYVVDFIDVHAFNFPVFNLADIFIVLGIILLIFIFILNITADNK